MLVAHSMVKPYVWEATIGNMCILIQGHLHATPQREVSVWHTVTVRASNDTMVVRCEASHRDELYGQTQHGTWSARLAIGLEYGVDTLNPVPRQKLLGRGGHRTNDLSTKSMVLKKAHARTI